MAVDAKFHLVKAIVSTLVFFEFSEEDTVNPDIAIQAMENISAELQLMDKDGQAYFCSQLQIVAASYSGDEAVFVNELGEALGLL